MSLVCSACGVPVEKDYDLLACPDPLCGGSILDDDEALCNHGRPVACRECAMEQNRARGIPPREPDTREAYDKLLTSWAELRAETELLRDWRATVTVALQREGGAHFADVPDHIRALVGTAKRYAELADAVVGPDRLSVEDRNFWTHEMTVKEANDARVELRDMLDDKAMAASAHTRPAAKIAEALREKAALEDQRKDLA